jgi:hypothetical protein
MKNSLNVRICTETEQFFVVSLIQDNYWILPNRSLVHLTILIEIIESTDQKYFFL